MNSAPMLRTCSHRFDLPRFDLRAVYWWQSRHNMRNPPALTDIPALAKQVRHAFGQ